MILIKVNWAYISPMQVAYYVKSKVLWTNKYELKSLKSIWTGGSKIASKIIEDFKKSLPHVNVVNSYGI